MAAPDSKSAFLKAAYDGELTLLKRLAPEVGNGGGLTKGYETVKDAKGRNALHLAAGAGKTLVCKFLVEKLKFHVESRDSQGNTPLIAAILAQHHPTVVYLIENGAGISCTNHEGFTALHYAAGKGQKDIMRLLMSKGAKVVPDLNTAVYTPLQYACVHGRKEAVKLLLDNGADPNTTTKIYFTPLVLSVSAESYECMELLLKAGADPNLASSGKAPLMFAACLGDTKTIKRLLKAGANPDVVESHGLMTPLENAALNDHVAAVKALFPFTSRISSFPDWSVDGILKHVHSEEALAQLNKRLEDDFQLSKAKGREAFESKEYVDAIYWYTLATSADPDDAAVLSNRSLCWVMLNQAEHALEDAKACVALKPDWPKAHYREGAAWMLYHEYSKASEAFSKALKLDPNNKEIKKAHREAVEAKFRMTVSENLQELHL